MQGQSQALALGKHAAQQRNGRGMPQVVANAHQHDANQQHPILRAKAHHEVRKAHPKKRKGHELALLPPHIHQHAARHIGDGAGRILARHDEANLAVGEAHFIANERQQHEEGGGVPMGE